MTTIDSPRAGGPATPVGNLSSEHGEREGVALPALLVEGATRAPGIGIIFRLDDRGTSGTIRRFATAKREVLG